MRRGIRHEQFFDLMFSDTQMLNATASYARRCDGTHARKRCSANRESALGSGCFGELRPAHRGAQHEDQMIDVQRVGDDRVLQGDHVVITVVRKPRV
jgi:hypothetical protein